MAALLDLMGDGQDADGQPCSDERFCRRRVQGVSDHLDEGQSSAFYPGLGKTAFAQAAVGQGHGRFVARPVGQGDA